MVKRKQDKSDLGLSYRRLWSPLARYASRYFKRHQEIEDVVQEAFLRVLEAEKQRNVEVTDSYLYRTVHNLALKILDKKDYRFTETIGEEIPETVLLETPTTLRQFPALILALKPTCMRGE